MSIDKTQKRAGFVTIVGKPNVGKSTLMNTLIGQKIAITSYKPQTTRTRIRTVYTDEEGQIVFLDTPGIHKAKTKLGEYMDRAAISTLKEVDLVLFLVEPKEMIREEDLAVMKLLAEAGTPVITVITKCDTVKKVQVLPVIAAYSAQWKKLTGEEAGEIIPVSARTRQGLDELKHDIFEKLPYGEPFYDEETVTEETERDIAAEIIREKALRLLQEEVPHGIAVSIVRMKFREKTSGNGGQAKATAKGAGTETENGAVTICDIDADIICERESHKGIIIGRGGEMLKKIGTAARTDIENMLDCKVNLKLFVKVRKDWKDNETLMKSLGYNMKDLR